MMPGSTIALIYIPTLASLGMVGAAFPALLQNDHSQEGHGVNILQIIYGVSIAVFLLSTTAISRYLIYPKEYEGSKTKMQLLLIVMSLINLLFMLLLPVLPAMVYLLCVFFSLVFIIIVITRNWYRAELKRLA